MPNESSSSTMYEKLREAFIAVNPTSAEEYLQLISHIFAGDDFWANDGNDYYIEYQFKDPFKPIKRFLEQKPVISSATFTMAKSDLEDQELLQYAQHVLTRSRGHLLTVNYVATWFFLKKFGLLLRCNYGNSKEKVLCLYHASESNRGQTHFLDSPLFEHNHREDFAETPIVFCGELRPSDLLDRGRGFHSAVVFPYDCMEWDEGRKFCSITAYLLEFPEPIEPVITTEELFEKMRAFQSDVIPGGDRWKDWEDSHHFVED